VIYRANGLVTATRAATFRDRFPTVGELAAPWRQHADYHPEMFDRVGVVPGGVATTGLTRPDHGGPPWVPNPGNVGGAADYQDHPGYAVPGIGGASIETHSESVVVSLTYGGYYDHSGGLHTEATPLLHITPGTAEFGVGCWFFTVGPYDWAVLGTVGAPPEGFSWFDLAQVPMTDGAHPVFTIDSDGETLTVAVDGVQVSFLGAGLNRVPVPEPLLGSTRHGFSIDQHIVDYTAGAPDLARMMSAPAFSDITIVSR